MTKYADLFDYVKKQTQKRVPSSPERNTGCQKPDNPYPLGPSNDSNMPVINMSSFNPPDQDDTQTDQIESKASATFPHVEKSKPTEPKSMELAFEDPDLDADEEHRDFMLRIFTVDY